MLLQDLRDWNRLPPNRWSTHPAGKAPRPNKKLESIYIHPSVSSPTPNSFWSVIIMAGKMSILAWTEKWETPVRVRIIFDSRVNMLIP